MFLQDIDMIDISLLTTVLCCLRGCPILSPTNQSIYDDEIFPPNSVAVLHGIAKGAIPIQGTTPAQSCAGMLCNVCR